MRRQLGVPLTAALLCMTATIAPGQDGELPRWRIDPYTKNDPELMAKLGYVSYGPFGFGQRGREEVTTEQIDASLDYAQILWVETEHFRIGTELGPWPTASDSNTRQKLRGELTRLKEILPKVNPKTGKLTPWLRLHLTAMRMEDLYREFLELVGVDDSEFPAGKEDVIIGRGRYLGYGPYLGMTEKFLVLVTDRGTTYGDYMQRYIGKSGDFGQRWHFTGVGSLFYGTATDLEGGRLKHDTALHCDLAFNVAHSLVDGFRHYSYDAPVWITEGLAHWFQRRVDPRWNSFSQNESTVANKRPLWRWEAHTRKLIASGKFTPFSEVYTWRDFSQIDFDDHVLVWSRWDFLMSLGQPKFSEFLFHVKGRVDPETWQVDQRDLVGATRTALRRTYGLTPLNLDDRWKAWVKENYSAQ